MGQIELIDTHSHIHEIAWANEQQTHTQQLWHKSGRSLEQVLEAGREAGVHEYMLVGCSVEDSELALEQAPNLRGAHVSIGVHPHEAARLLSEPALMQRFEALAGHELTEAIGECGLDYFYEHSDRESQIKVLQWQLDLAKRHKKPLIFHVREAYDDFWPIYEAAGAPSGVLHSYTDSADNLARALSNGLLIGVNGIATFAKDPKQQAMYQAIPLESMVLETDAPYLTPAPHRGRVNELQHVRDIAEFVAKTRSVELGQVASQTTANARALFNL